MQEFNADIRGREPPVHRHTQGVAVAAPGGYLCCHPGLFREAAVEALAGQYAELARGQAGRLPWGGV